MQPNSLLVVHVHVHVKPEGVASVQAATLAILRLPGQSLAQEAGMGMQRRGFAEESFPDQQQLLPRPTGDFVFNAPSSMLFAPVVTVPLMSVGGLPVGIQLMGQQHEDARMTGLARWFVENLKRVATPA